MCASVRTRLRPLVTTRIGEAQQRIAELTAFVTSQAGVYPTSAVHEARSGLAPASPRPDAADSVAGWLCRAHV